jgi:polysaccharide deacetylase family protein (PEP-CTERM system associated)
VKTPPVRNALTIDVEEYYHGMEFEAALPSEERKRLPSRVEPSVERVLALLDRTAVQATFFVLGCVARQHRGIVKAIQKRGHEIACHGDTHELVSRQTPGEFRGDVRRAKAVLEDLAGEPVIGYRAPNYSISEKTAWAFDILGEEDFRYDSSVYPIHHDRYGFPKAPRFPHVLRGCGARTLWEFPLGTMRLFELNFPIGGGGPFRLFPYAYFRHGIRRVNRREGHSTVFYFHPWELDPGQPRTPMPFLDKFRHYVNLHRSEIKLERLLRDIPFAPAREVLGLSINGEDRQAEARP